MCFFLVIYSSCLHSESQLNVPQNVSWLVLRKVGICGHAFVNVISCFIFKKKKAPSCSLMSKLTPYVFLQFPRLNR